MFHMETSRLRYFCTIAETGSLTKASGILGVTHSGLSKAISTLEAETKLKLFRSLGRGLEITSEGKWFYQKAKEILRIESDIQSGVLMGHTSVRIGLSEVIAITCAGAMAQDFKIPLTMITTDIGEIEGKIIADEIDFGIAFSPMPKPELEYLEIGEVVFNSYARNDLQEKFISSDIPYVVPATDFPFNPLGYRMRDGWPQNIPRRPYFSVNGYSIAFDLLQAGAAAMYLPNFVVQIFNKNTSADFIIKKISDHSGAITKRKIFLIKSKLVEETKEMKKMAKIIRRICCSL
jgi:DNA-binding transcriptional LysR family regulator